MAPALPVPDAVRAGHKSRTDVRIEEGRRASPAADAVQRELLQQRQLVKHLHEGEIPALRMEIAFLRADLHALQELVGSDSDHSRPKSRGTSVGNVEVLHAAAEDCTAIETIGDEDDSGFERSADVLPPTITRPLAAMVVPASAADASTEPPSPSVEDVSRVGRGLSLASMGPKTCARTELVVVDALESNERWGEGAAPRPMAETGEMTPRCSSVKGRSLMVLSLEPNIWDCALMCALAGWRQSFGRFNTVISNVLLIVNVIAQLMFVMIMVSVVQSDADEQPEDVMMSYRLLVGHSYLAMDSKTLTSRMQQVCNQKWYDQVGMFLTNLEDYLIIPGETDLWLVPGKVVCLVAMFTWIVSIYSELRRLGEDLLVVILSLPVSKEVQLETRGTFSVIVAVPRHHKAYCMIILLARAFIALGLLVSGLCFLVHTREVVNLLTNAVAMEYVRRIDEVLFEAIVPRKLMGCLKVVKIRVHSTHWFTHEMAGGWFCRWPRPQECMPHNSVFFQNCMVLTRFLMISGILLIAYCWKLLPVVNQNWALYESLCGSNLDFVYQTHPVTGLPVFASVNPYKAQEETVRVEMADMGSLRCFYASTYEMLRMRAGVEPMYSDFENQTVRSLIDGSNELCKMKDSGEWTPCLDRDLRFLGSMTLTTWTAYFNDPWMCKDEDVSIAVLRNTCLSDTFVQSSPELAFFQDVHSCRDFASDCKATRGQRYLSIQWQERIGKLCPVTCGKCTFGSSPDDGA